MVKKRGLEESIKLKPIGYTELIRRYSLEIIPHHIRSYLTDKGRRKTIINGTRSEEIFPLKYDPGNTLGEQLTFALKFEGINLGILSALFKKIDKKELLDFIKATPGGKYSRKIWFLYEFLTGENLDLPQVDITNYIDLLEKEEYYTAIPIPHRRSRVNNNLLGDVRFCPVVRKTDLLRKFEESKLDQKSLGVIKKYPQDILQRALSYLYTKETKSSFEIEKIAPDQKRASRFVELLKYAGHKDFFNKESLIELQKAIVDSRFANDDFRNDQNYVGQTVNFREEIIHYISPKPEDLQNLMNGMFFSHDCMLRAEIHPVVIAAVIAFAFVFIHPFDDGNGRIHRFLIHNMLAKNGFTPAEFIFPVSAVMLKNIKKYDEALETFSNELLPLLDYSLDKDGIMTVKNETAPYYRYIDMTEIAQRLFGFIEETIEKELVSELDFIIDYDKAKKEIQNIVDMPDQMIDLFIRLCIQNNGHLSTSKRKNHFYMLADEEIKKMEGCIQNLICLFQHHY